MSDIKALREMSIKELDEHLLVLRKKQFNLRMQKANGTLDKSHHITMVRKEIARLKTLITEKAGTANV